MKTNITEIVKAFESGKIKTIVKVPMDVAKTIYENDKWFDGKPGKRYVNLTLVGSDLVVKKCNEDKDIPVNPVCERENYHEINKERHKESHNKDYLLRLAFSVNGNKGPYDYFVENLSKKNTESTTDVNKALMAHFAYLTGWGAHNDSTFKKILNKSDHFKSHASDTEDAKEKREQLCKTFKDKQKDITEALISNDETDNEDINNYIEAYRTYYKTNYPTNTNLQMDLNNAKLYLANLDKGVKLGGARKTKRKQVKSNKKAKKDTKKQGRGCAKTSKRKQVSKRKLSKRKKLKK